MIILVVEALGRKTIGEARNSLFIVPKRVPHKNPNCLFKAAGNRPFCMRIFITLARQRRNSNMAPSPVWLFPFTPLTISYDARKQPVSWNNCKSAFPEGGAFFSLTLRGKNSKKRKKREGHEAKQTGKRADLSFFRGPFWYYVSC